MLDDARSAPLVSLIVVTYNSAGLLPAFFGALARTEYPRYEVLVVDNASADGTLHYLAERQPGARVIASGQNLGFGRACNRGADAARGDLLVFLNPDVQVTPGWLASLVRHMGEQPDAAIICPETLYPREELGSRDWGPGNEPDPQSVAPRPQPLCAATESAAVPGCAMMVRRSAWEGLGGFDERIFLYWEDTELCWRAWLCGWRVLSDHEAIVFHERGGSGGGRWDAERTKNGLYVHLKLMRWRKALPFAAVLALKTLAKVAARREAGLLGAWSWNFRHLGETLAQRRELARSRRAAPARVERLVAAHERRTSHERRERRRELAARRA